MPKVTIIPFYGGGKGQSLQIVEKPDGTVMTYIIKTPVETQPTTEEETIDPTDLENPDLPSKQDLNFGPNLRNIHRTALNIINLQELLKKNGRLQPEEEQVYKKNLDALNTSAENLAKIQGEDLENREGLVQWFENKRNSLQKKEENKEGSTTEKPNEEELEEVGEEDNDGVSIGLPPEDASVAEAKPVGLAVAGEGGVAASKPIATAVVGPGGLAIARPVGTAIAGVAPDQALIPIYAEGYIIPSKPKRNGTSGSKNKQDQASQFLGKLLHKYHQK